MMRKWLQSGDQPTWGKLDDAVKLLKGRVYESITGVSNITHIPISLQATINSLRT